MRKPCNVRFLRNRARESPDGALIKSELHKRIKFIAKPNLILVGNICLTSRAEGGFSYVKISFPVFAFASRTLIQFPFPKEYILFDEVL